MSLAPWPLASEPDAFAADAAHQLRAPLARFCAELELLLAEAGELEPGTRLRLEVLRGEVERQLRTCQRLLLLARLRGGLLRVAGIAGEVDLGALAEELVEQVTPLALQRAVLVSLRCDRGPWNVRGCRETLVEALLNLLDNAIRYTHGGGRVELTLQTGGGQVLVSVSDTGPGIPVEDRRRVFRRFFRGSSVAGETGTGLGLAIARSVARAHGGELTLHSPPAGGATFRLRLPAL